MLDAFFLSTIGRGSWEYIRYGYLVWRVLKRITKFITRNRDFCISFSNILFQKSHVRRPNGPESTAPRFGARFPRAFLCRKFFIKITLLTRFPANPARHRDSSKSDGSSHGALYILRSGFLGGGAGEGDWCFRFDGGSRIGKKRVPSMRRMPREPLWLRARRSACRPASCAIKTVQAQNVFSRMKFAPVNRAHANEPKGLFDWTVIFYENNVG